MQRSQEPPRNPGRTADLRALAETELAHRAAGAEAARPPPTEELLHELQVHQIELETQNEELRRSQVELEASRARYYDLYDLAPVGYLTLSAGGLIVEANLTAAGLLGVARGSLINQPLTRFIEPEDQDTYYRSRRQLSETGGVQVWEMRMRRANAPPFWARMEAAVAQKDEDGSTSCRAVISDVTDRRQIDDARTFLLQCGHQSSGEDFFEELARYLARVLRMDFVCIDQLRADGLAAETLAVYADGEFEDNMTYALKDTPCGHVVGQTICCFPEHVRRRFPADAVLQRLLAESYVGTTLWSHDGRPIGLIALVSREPLADPRVAQSVLELAAVRAGGELERRRAEEARAEAHRQRLTILESIGDGFFSLDRQWRVVYINERGAGLIGKSRQELLGKSLWESFPQAEALPFRQAYERALAEQRTTSVEAFFAPLNAWFDVHAYPSPEGLSVFYQNTTDRKAAREQIESLARFPSENTNPVLRADRDGRLLFANEASLPLLAEWRSKVGGPLPDHWRERVSEALRNGIALSAEAGAEGRVFSIHLVPLAAAGYVNLYCTDVTELREAQRRELEAREAASAARASRDMLDAMQEGVMLLAMTGTIVSVNPAMAHIVGYAVDELVGRSAGDFIPLLLRGQDLTKAACDLDLLQRGAQPEMAPVTLHLHDGRSVPVVPSAAFIRNPAGKPLAIVFTLRDISQLAESERKYRELVENANSIIMRITPGHDITFFNEYAQRFFGYEAAEVLGRNVVGTIVPEVDSEGRDLREMVRGITERPEHHTSNENENMCKDGRRVWVYWANRAVRDDCGNVREILCVGTDVTARRRVEAQNLLYQERLRGLAERLAASEEKARWQISRYVHDTVIQNLSLSSMKLGVLEAPLAKAELSEERAALNAVRTLIDTAVEECRTVMSELTPALLYDLGLVPALVDLAERLREQHGATVHVTEEGEAGALDHGLRGLLFQSTRELVLNALKHAGQTDVHVSVAHRHKAIRVRVHDDGTGFDPATLGQSVDKPGGFGLFSVRERVEGLGGRLQIDSAPGQGTTARIIVPVRPGAAG